MAEAGGNGFEEGDNAAQLGRPYVAGALASQPRALWRGHFGLAGRNLSVEADDAAAVHMLETAYGDCLEPHPRTAASNTAAIKRLNDGRLSVRFDRRPLTVGVGRSSSTLAAYYAVKEIFARFASVHPGAIAFSGSLVEVQGAALLILGAASIGKTLLALHLAMQGARFLGDETVVLDLGSRTAFALARKPTLREGALTMLPVHVRERIEAAEHVAATERGRLWYALHSGVLGGIAPSPAGYRLGSVAIIRERSSEPAIARTPAERSLPVLMQRAYARPSHLTAADALRRSMRDVACYDVSLAEPERTASALLEEVGTCA